MSLKDYEWVPQLDNGSFWSLHKKKEGFKSPCYGEPGYIGWVTSLFSSKLFESGKPGLRDIKEHLNMREAAKRVESWVKE